MDVICIHCSLPTDPVATGRQAGDALEVCCSACGGCWTWRGEDRDHAYLFPADVETAFSEALPSLDVAPLGAPW
jgi:hypothetical protein